MDIQIYRLSFDKDEAERKAKQYIADGYTLINIFWVMTHHSGAHPFGYYEGVFVKNQT